MPKRLGQFANLRGGRGGGGGVGKKERGVFKEMLIPQCTLWEQNLCLFFQALRQNRFHSIEILIPSFNKRKICSLL